MIGAFSTITSAFEKADLTNFTGKDFKPTVFFQVNFPSGKSVQLGNELTPDEAKEEPTYSFTSEDPSATYTMLCVDPDAPTRENPTYGLIAHEIQTGLKADGVDGTASVKKTEQPWMPYIGPGPPPKTKLHRYVFLLYRETAPLAPLSAQSYVKGVDLQARIHFPIEKFVEENKLELVGGNYFVSQNPEQ